MPTQRTVSGAADELRVAEIDGSTFAESNVSGDLAADFQIKLLGLHSLAADDFVL